MTVNKVFQMNRHDFVAANSLEDAINFYDRLNYHPLENPREVPLDHTCMYDGDITDFRHVMDIWPRDTPYLICGGD
jgi:hypothetical protein